MLTAHLLVGLYIPYKERIRETSLNNNFVPLLLNQKGVIYRLPPFLFQIRINSIEVQKQHRRAISNIQMIISKPKHIRKSQRLFMLNDKISTDDIYHNYKLSISHGCPRIRHGFFCVLVHPYAQLTNQSQCLHHKFHLNNLYKSYHLLLHYYCT